MKRPFAAGKREARFIPWSDPNSVFLTELTSECDAPLNGIISGGKANARFGVT